jgi:hypothetical protein
MTNFLLGYSVDPKSAMASNEEMVFLWNRQEIEEEGKSFSSRTATSGRESNKIRFVSLGVGFEKKTDKQTEMRIGEGERESQPRHDFEIHQMQSCSFSCFL